MISNNNNGTFSADVKLSLYVSGQRFELRLAVKRFEYASLAVGR